MVVLLTVEMGTQGVNMNKARSLAAKRTLSQQQLAGVPLAADITATAGTPAVAATTAMKLVKGHFNQCS